MASQAPSLRPPGNNNNPQNGEPLDLEPLMSSIHALAPTKMVADPTAEMALTVHANVFGDRGAVQAEGDHAYDMSVYKDAYEKQAGENVMVERDPDVAYFNHQATKYTWSFEGTELPEGAKYEWIGEEGIIGPIDVELEKELYKNDFVMRAGEHLNAYSDKVFDVSIICNEKFHHITNFDDAGLHPAMLANLKMCGYHNPMPIQSYVIPAVLLGKDVAGCAQTGSGKTAAYLIPIFSRLMGRTNELSAVKRQHEQNREGPAKPLVLIMCPTRELAVQIFWEARRFSYRTMLRPVCVYGGAPTRAQLEDLRAGCDILIATPGRLLDILRKPDRLNLRNLRFTVLDEADELLEADWEDVMDHLIAGPYASHDQDHTFLMFSATFPGKARRTAKEVMDSDGCFVRVGRPGSTHANIRQDVVWVDGDKKQEALYDLLCSLPPARTIVFVNSRNMAESLDKYLYSAREMPSTYIHNQRTQFEREEAMRAFITGRAPILVATGISARGIDVRNVLHIVNYDLPSAEHGGINEYVHRIGRTGRIGHQGRATSFFNDRDSGLAPALVKVLLESHQAVPDFLEEYKPEDPDNIDFDDPSDEEEDLAGGGDASGGGMDNWGNGDAVAEEESGANGFSGAQGFQSAEPDAAVASEF